MYIGSSRRLRKRVVLVFLIAPLVVLFQVAAGGVAAAQTNVAAPVGDPAGGKAVWALGNTACRNCHGPEGEGAFGPVLAGRKLSFERFKDYVRNPAGRMPAYIESELTDQEIADLAAYFNSLPPVQKPGSWRFELTDGAPHAQQLSVTVIGCGQCHGPTLETPRHGAGEVNGDWEWFKHMVYEHTTAQREQWGQLDPAITPATPRPAGPPGRNRMRMGNYSPLRLPEPMLKEIWMWMTDLGPLVPLTGRITAGAAGSAGFTYTVNVANAGVKNTGLAAEDVTITLEVPENAQVLSVTGAGYEGVRHNGESKKGPVAVWRVPRLAPTDQQTFTITLSTVAKNLRGTVRWGKPAVKADNEVTIALTGGGRGGV